MPTCCPWVTCAQMSCLYMIADKHLVHCALASYYIHMLFAGAGAGRPASQPSQDAAPAWKKGGGGALSAKAKKEYLQWKRAQKREKADGDSDSDWGNEETPSTSAPAPAAAAAPRAADARAKPLNQETAESGSGGSDEELVPSTSRPDPRVKPSTGRQGTAQEQQEQQQHSTRTKQSVSALPDSKAGLSSDSGLDDGNGDDESRDHRDEDVNVRMTAGAARPNKGTRKGAAYQARLAAQETHALALAQATKGDSAARYTSCDDPLQYVHMEEMPEGDVPPGVTLGLCVRVVLVQQVRKPFRRCETIAKAATPLASYRPYVYSLLGLCVHALAVARCPLLPHVANQR